MKIRNFFAECSVVVIIAIVLAVVYQVSHYDFLRSILSYYMPFWLGIFMGQYKELYNLITNNNNVFTVSLLLFCLLVGLFFGNADIWYGKLVRLFCGLISIPIMFSFFKGVKLPEKLNKAMCYVGQNTLPIYIMQFYFIRGLVEINGLNLFYQIVLFSIVSILMIAVILFLTRILDSSILCRKLLLGRK